MRWIRAAAVKTAILGLVTGSVLLWAPPAASASGGGGCGGPVTDATGTAVEIRSFCFTPSVLRTEPGQTVTFTNWDPFGHTVLGTNGSWGSFDILGKNDGSVSYRFVLPGVYSYVCTIHPGMVGTVVVGSASGPGEAGATTTKRGPVTLVVGDPNQEIAPFTLPGSDAQTDGRIASAGTAPAVRSSGGSHGLWPALAAVAAALLLAALATIVGQRRSLRRSRSAS